MRTGNGVIEWAVELFGCRRGAIVTAFIVCYALTSFIAGYVSGGFYSRNDGTHPYPSIVWSLQDFWDPLSVL